MENNIIVVDIDGTLSKVGDRLKYLKQTPKDWDKFYDACFEDEPIEEICELIRKIDGYHLYNIVFLTGRRESVRDVTSKWLVDNVYSIINESHDFYKCAIINYSNRLLMRPNNDFRHDTEVKLEMFKKAGYKVEDIVFVLEDRDSMVKMWRNLGVKCLQVADGNF